MVKRYGYGRMTKKLFTPPPKVESREKLHARLKYESSVWLEYKAVADRSEGFDGDAVHKAGVSMRVLDKLLDRLFVIDMSTIPVMDEDPHEEVAPHKIDHINEPLDGRSSE